MCLQVNSDADFVLANSGAARWYTSPLVKQGLASDRDLPGLQNHACKRAYVPSKLLTLILYTRGILTFAEEFVIVEPVDTEV